MTTPGAADSRFAAPVHEVVSVESWPDYAEAHRWTDGAPVYPPTEAAVAALLDAIDADPAAELGTIPPRQAVVTVETVAIISGPAVARLGLWTEECVFGGGGNRANVAIGRAIRLLLWNVGGGYPG